MQIESFSRRLAMVGLVAATASAFAQSEAVSEASALSALPIAVSVEVPALLVSGAAELTVVAVEASATGTVWVLERASDGARASVRWTGQAVGGASTVAGAAVLVTAIGAGWVLSSAGRAIAFVPNRIGAALLHNERVTR